MFQVLAHLKGVSYFSLPFLPGHGHGCSNALLRLLVAGRYWKPLSVDLKFNSA